MLKNEQQVLELISEYYEAPKPAKPRYLIRLLDSIRFPLTVDEETRLYYNIPHGYTNCPKEAQDIWAKRWEKIYGGIK